MALLGIATREGTARYIDRFPALLEATAFRRFRKLRLSSLGLGTLLGDPSDLIDDAYRAAISKGLTGGINVIDTSPHYRQTRSECLVGQLLQQAVSSRLVSRDEVILCTKGGISPQQQIVPQGQSLPGKELAAALELSAIESSFEQSLTNLDVEGIDIYFISGSEISFGAHPREQTLNQLGEIFAYLEKQVQAGRLGCYGLACQTGIVAERSSADYIGLEEILKLAQTAGGTGHNFAAVQLPLNLSKTEALALKNQYLQKKKCWTTVSNVALEYGLGLFPCSSLQQGNLARYLPFAIKQHFRGIANDSQVALQFARSCPAVKSSLVGIRQLPHVEQALGLLAIPPESPENFVRFFEAPDKSLSISGH